MEGRGGWPMTDFFFRQQAALDPSLQWNVLHLAICRPNDFPFQNWPISISHFKGAVAHGVSSLPKKFEFASLCSFICLQAVYQLSGPVCKATWNGCPSYSASYLHFTLCD